MLAKNCSCGFALTWKDGSPFKCRQCKDGDVRRLTLEPADPKVVALDRWAVDRFLHPDRAPVHFIDRMPLGHAAETMKRIGVLSLGGYQRRWTGRSELGEPHVVRAHGFDSIVTGTVDMVLDHAYEGYVAANRDPTPSLSLMYGWFYPWFLYNGGPRLSPGLGEIIFQHASKKIHVTRRSILSRSGTSHVTLSEAASIAKVQHSTMRKLLAAENLIGEQKRKGVPLRIERASAERIAADLQQSLNLASLGGALGLSSTALTKLVRGGLLPIWLTGGAHGHYLFRGNDVLRWMETIIGAAPTVRVMPHGTVNLADASQRCSIAITVLVRAIVAGELKVVAVLNERRNFMSALVHIEAVFAYKNKIGAEAAKDPLRNYVRAK
jgi:hypothetical protein